VDLTVCKVNISAVCTFVNKHTLWLEDLEPKFSLLSGAFLLIIYTFSFCKCKDNQFHCFFCLFLLSALHETLWIPFCTQLFIRIRHNSWQEFATKNRLLLLVYLVGFRLTSLWCGAVLPIMRMGTAARPISTTRYWLSLGSVPIWASSEVYESRLCFT
jgi:hypothetical protein